MVHIKYAANGKRDIHNLEAEFESALEELKTESWKHPNNQAILLHYIRDCKQGRAKSGGSNKRVGRSTLYRIMGIIRMLSERWLKKDFDKATSKDWSNLYDQMEEDKIKNEYGKNYKPNTKAKIYKVLRKFLKWKYGNNKTYPEYCDHWVTSEETLTKEYLTRSEVDRLIEGIPTLKIKCLFMMLFDGGFRIEELGNLRWCDVKKPEGKDYYRAFVRAETSKTKKERHVSLWLATDLITTYKSRVKSKLKKEFKDTDYLFSTSYHNLYSTVRVTGKRILNKNISPHTLRHSSATYYASIIKTYQQFCSRYGWALKSGIAQRYFHATTDEDIADQAKDHELARFKTEFERMQIENKQLRESHDKLERQQKHMHKILTAMQNERLIRKRT